MKKWMKFVSIVIALMMLMAIVPCAVSEEDASLELAAVDDADLEPDIPVVPATGTETDEAETEIEYSNDMDISPTAVGKEDILVKLEEQGYVYLSTSGKEFTVYADPVREKEACKVVKDGSSVLLVDGYENDMLHVRFADQAGSEYNGYIGMGSFVLMTADEVAFTAEAFGLKTVTVNGVVLYETEVLIEEPTIIEDDVDIVPDDVAIEVEVPVDEEKADDKQPVETVKEDHVDDILVENNDDAVIDVDEEADDNTSDDIIPQEDAPAAVPAEVEGKKTDETPANEDPDNKEPEGEPSVEVVKAEDENQPNETPSEEELDETADTTDDQGEPSSDEEAADDVNGTPAEELKAEENKADSEQDKDEAPLEETPVDETGDPENEAEEAVDDVNDTPAEELKAEENKADSEQDKDEASPEETPDDETGDPENEAEEEPVEEEPEVDINPEIEAEITDGGYALVKAGSKLYDCLFRYRASAKEDTVVMILFRTLDDDGNDIYMIRYWCESMNSLDGGSIRLYADGAVSVDDVEGTYEVDYSMMDIVK